MPAFDDDDDDGDDGDDDDDGDGGDDDDDDDDVSSGGGSTNACFRCVRASLLQSRGTRAKNKQFSTNTRMMSKMSIFVTK